MKETQRCDVVIDSLLGGAIEEIEKLRAKNRELGKALFDAEGDVSCLLKDDPETGKIPPRAEFLESCSRFHDQIANEKGELEGCKTIAQLEQELAEYEASFDLRWKADMRAIKWWSEAHPGKVGELVWPDHADLCVWLLERNDMMKKIIAAMIDGRIDAAEAKTQLEPL